ncbi:hypothetical protein [Marinomonas balearica]|uniref:Uncharacterized protein n=1 Tax=Marinomonas balearica TaxID=491947 RepID=A0A4R6M954_9GAMM|nr:hypothetical protein [Marinomonas balearica]TDO96689.1 hypothetical protein DFP79_2452 [Marinomonas balearica]
MSELAVEANVQIMVELDKGQLNPPLLGKLPVASNKLKSKNAIAFESDVKEFLDKKLIGAKYTNGTFLNGAIISYSIEALPLSKTLKKGNEFAVLAGKIVCEVDVMPAIYPNVGADKHVPERATITLTPTQTKLKS